MSKERGRVPSPKEAEPQPYSLAARYTDDNSSEEVYFQVQHVLDSHPDLALSSFRLQLRRLHSSEYDWYVTVLGEQPPSEYEDLFRRILSSGEPVTLPDDVREWLFKRRKAATQIGPRVEGHYRPGLPRRIE